MKLEKRPQKPFLVLPMVEVLKMPKNTGLKLFTKTWPPKRDTGKNSPNKEDPARPLTATLDKPTILNINFIGIIDMSTVRKEFLNISNLCRFPISLGIPKRKRVPPVARPLSLPSPSDPKTKKKSNKKISPRNGNTMKNRPETSAEDSWAEESFSVRSANNSSSKSGKMKILLDAEKLKTKRNFSDNNNNNNKTFKMARKRAAPVKLSDITGNGKSTDAARKSTKLLPEPCKTCGRPDQPERFHSHPPIEPLKATKKPQEPPKMKSTVQKPVAIKYKSKQSTDKKNLPPPTARKPSLPAQKLVHTPPNLDSSSSTEKRATSAKRTLTCYICGREFGTASLRLHEPKCLEKLERENSALPSHLRRKVPVKPDHGMSQEEWNKFAWESSQATLTPCGNCGRTFFPDRLAVHQRSCKIVQDNSKSAVEKTAPAVVAVPPMPPPSVECYICGKLFGHHSIKIHERQCLKKWHIENDSLPADMRSPQPTRKEGTSRSPAGTVQQVPAEPEKPPSASKKPPMFPCYLCGRLFTVNSIYIHEPQCLKMWKIENEKLPPNKRRPVPLKPDVKFTPTGDVDFRATFNRIWENHLAELIPCYKCGRKFFPDRIEKHEAACAGTKIQTKTKK